MPDDARAPGASVTSRALALLGAFDEDHPVLRMVDLAKRANLPNSTAYRLLGELTRWGALEQLETGEYRIGTRLWRLGTLATAPGTLREAASPFLHDVYAVTLATVHLAVRAGTDALIIARLAGHRSVPILTPEGTRAPLHATAVGKVLLAYAPQAVVEQTVQELTAVTSQTITAPGLLARQLRKVHEDGFAASNEEMSLGASGVAVPVLAGDEVVAALGAAVRTDGSDRTRLINVLQVASRGISRNLGPRSHPMKTE